MKRPRVQPPYAVNRARRSSCRSPLHANQRAKRNGLHGARCGAMPRLWDKNKAWNKQKHGNINDM
jgi:hypothetical protein